MKLLSRPTAQNPRKTMPRMPSVGGIVAAIVAVLVLILVLSAVHLLPQLRNPFAETTTVRSQPVILKSITNLSRYEAASGSFEVVVDLTKRASLIPSFLEGSETLFIGQGTDIAFVDFSTLKNRAITVNADRTSVTVTLPKPQLEPALRSEEHTSELQSRRDLVCRLLLEKKKKNRIPRTQKEERKTQAT